MTGRKSPQKIEPPLVTKSSTTMAYNSKYYICAPPQPKTGPPGYTLMKVGITSSEEHGAKYVRARYGKGTRWHYSRNFFMHDSNLKRYIETPILKNLKRMGDLCEIVCSKKEHFWVKHENVNMFVRSVKDMLRSMRA